MKKQTYLQLPTPYLIFVLVISSLVSPACAASVQSVPGQTAPARTTSPTQTQSELVAAIVKAQHANLRKTPSRSGTTVRTVAKGDLLTVIDPTPVGPWHRVRDAKTHSEGWIHENTITVLHPTQGAATDTSQAGRPRRTSTPVSGRSYINVDGVRVSSPVFSETKPAGATARCRDGSYSFSQHRRGTCSYHGGVAEWF